MYETMVYWETADVPADESPATSEWAQLWRAADKVIYSRSLESTSIARSRIEREFDPDAVRAMKDTVGQDITIGGANLAAQAFRAGLVDRCQLYLTPVIVGGGKPALPGDVRLDLRLLDERRFANGVVFLDYRVR
jgi:dihydrofolate reductase